MYIYPSICKFVPSQVTEMCVCYNLTNYAMFFEYCHYCYGRIYPLNENVNHEAFNQTESYIAACTDTVLITAVNTEYCCFDSG